MIKRQSSARVETSHLERYDRDGVVLIENAFDPSWIDLLLKGWKRIQEMRPDDMYDLPKEFLDNDPRLAAEIESTRSSDAEQRKLYAEQSSGFLRFKYMRWWIPEFREFAMESPAAELIGTVINSETVRFFIDAIFMKEPKCETRTYWHSDRSAWPAKGNHIPTMWMPLLPVSAKLSSLEYIAGSQHYETQRNPWPNSFNAKNIGKPADRADFVDWEDKRGDPGTRFLAYDMNPGDVVILHPDVYHGGGPNLHPTQPRIAYSTRWFGSDVVWDPHPECVNVPGMPLDKMPTGKPVTENDIFPLLWKRMEPAATPV